MPKETRRSKRSSRAVRRLEPYNKSPSQRGHSRSSQGSRHESPEREDPPNRTEEPPSWAKELLQQQKLYSKELKKLKNEIDDAKLRKHGKLSDPEPEFRFEGNKKQYKLNRDVLDKIDRAKNTSDDESRSELLEEGEQLLLERNKHICLADKYGWDTVECYAAEPLASDSGDEKRIKKAIKESKQLREEKRKAAAAKWKPKKSPLPRGVDGSKRVVEKTHNFRTAGMSSNVARDPKQLCFRCGRNGHYARDCRASVASGSPGWGQNNGQSSGSQQ